MTITQVTCKRNTYVVVVDELLKEEGLVVRRQDSPISTCHWAGLLNRDDGDRRLRWKVGVGAAAGKGIH